METIDFQMTAKFLKVNCSFWTDNEKKTPKNNNNNSSYNNKSKNKKH